MNFILDTHIFPWVLSEPEKLDMHFDPIEMAEKSGFVLLDYGSNDVDPQFQKYSCKLM